MTDVLGDKLISAVSRCTITFLPLKLSRPIANTKLGKLEMFTSNASNGKLGGR